MEIARSAAAGCSKEQQRIYADWFTLADPDGDGRVTGADATKFFAMSGLSRADLKQVSHPPCCYLNFTAAECGLTNPLPIDSRFGQLPTPSGRGSSVSASSRQRCSSCFWHKRGTRSPRTASSAKVLMNYFLHLSPATNNWFSSKSAKKTQMPLTAVTSVFDGLKRLYIEKLKPLEVACRFNDFASPSLKNSDFDAKPTVMLLGQYSTGKTTFIKHLLKTSYPGLEVLDGALLGGCWARRRRATEALTRGRRPALGKCSWAAWAAWMDSAYAQILGDFGFQLCRETLDLYRIKSEFVFILHLKVL